MNITQFIITVLGGLAIFVYGMGLMSEGLTQIAGDKMKAILAYVTRNRVAAILAGGIVTMLIQSSSATCVMTVGFVNAGLLSLQQAIGVIFGANIGTTVTGQLVSFNLDDMALPAVVIGVAGLMFSRRAMVRGAWKTALGFGLLFYGMGLMSHELKVVAKLPEFISFFSKFDCSPSASGFLPMANMLGAIAVGTICTMVVQSSSATIGITIALANSGLINIWTAVPIVLGDNIGTTITAALASIGTNANARRTALAHALFNLIGTTVLVCTFCIVFPDSSNVRAPAFYHLVAYFTEGRQIANVNTARYVAMAHTLFNITNVIILASFIPLLAKICRKIIPDDKSQCTVTLEPHLLAAPEMALKAVSLALADMTRRAWTVASASLNNCLGKAHVDEEAVQKAENEIDETHDKIRDYLIRISQHKLTDNQAEMIPEIIHCINDAERISDLAVKIYRKTSRIKREGVPEDITESLHDVISKVREFARETVGILRSGKPSARDPEEVEKSIHAMAKAVSRSFASHLNTHTGTANNGIAFLSVLSGLRDISRHLGNIATRANAFAG